MECKDPKGQVSVFFLPPNSTAIFQPLDQGIISILKTQYKYKLLNKVIEAADHYDELQVLAKDVSAGRKGLKYGCPAHVLDAAEIFKSCWNNLEPSAVASCWTRARCLPHTETVAVSAENRDYKKRIEAETIENMCKLFSGLLCEASTMEGLGLDDVVNARYGDAEQHIEDRTGILQRWINIEKDPEVMAADDIRVLEEIRAEFDNSALLSSSETDHESCSDTSLLAIDDENMPSDTQPAFNEDDALAQIVASSLKVHSIAGKLDDPVLLDLAVRMHDRAKATLQAKHSQSL